jgi:hypothetical protein
MHASRYQIVVSGRLGVAGREAFRDFQNLIGLTCLATGPDIRLAR